MLFRSGVGPVVGDTAHFRYTDVRIDAWCGPKVRVSCADGGSQVCNLCEEVGVELRSPKSPRFKPFEVKFCDLPCPKQKNSELERIKRFAEHFPNGRVPVPDSLLGIALYRTHAACKADPLWKPAKPASPKKTKAKP